MASFRRNIFRGILLIMAGLLVFWLIRVTDPRYIMRLVLEGIRDFGSLAPLYFVIAYVLACLTFFPGVFLTLGGGILFGVFMGTLYVCIGATIGAACAFLISRYVARGWVYKRFAANDKFRAIDDAVEKDGWKIVGLIRLSPAFPFVPLNFVFGLTSIPLSHFVIVTFISIIPMSAMFVYLGSLIGDIAALGSEPIAKGKTKWIVTAVGVVTTIIVTLLVTRIARRALAARLPELANEESEDRAASG